MADFSTYAEADARAVAKVADKTWVNAHSARATTGGKIAVRVQRKMSPTNPGYGAWVEITDNGGT
jgi:hypothetical protein